MEATPKHKVVSINDLTQDNPTLCLSTHRAFEQCYKCQVYQNARKRGTVHNMQCTPQISDDGYRMLNELNHIERDFKKARERRDVLRQGLGLK